MKTLEVPDHLYDALSAMIETLVRKGQDYANSEEAWDSNFKFTAELFGLERWESADFNEAQKLARLSALRRRGAVARNESVVDSYLDKAVYALIAYALLLHHNAIAHPGGIIATGPLTGENAAIALGGGARG